MKKIKTIRPVTRFRWLILVALLMVATICWYVFQTRIGTNATNSVETTRNGSQNTPPTLEEQRAEAMGDADRESLEQAQEDNPRIPLTITAINQTDASLQVRVLIPSLTPGTCVLSLKNNSQSVTLSVDTQALASTSTCKGFDIPLSQLSSGSWILNIEYRVGDTITGGVTQEVVIK